MRTISLKDVIGTAVMPLERLDCEEVGMVIV